MKVLIAEAGVVGQRHTALPNGPQMLPLLCVHGGSGEKGIEGT